MSIAIEQITDYDSNLSLLLTQFKDSTNLRGLLSAANSSANTIEQALFDIRDGFWLDTAIGVQLDVIGDILGIARTSLDDTIYREGIRARLGLLFSGEPEGILSALTILFGATFAHYYPGYPAIPGSYYIFTDAVISNSQLEILSPAGVQALIGNNIIDAVGNDIVDAVGNIISCVAPLTGAIYDLSLEDGDLIALEDGDNLFLYV